MSDINYPDSEGPLSENYSSDEELMSADLLIGQEVVYKNLTTMALALGGVQLTGQDYVLHGLQLVWTAALACSLKTGLALSTQGEYYSATGSWAFVANAGASGNAFSVFNPVDQVVSLSPYVSSTGVVICTVQIAPAIVQNSLLSRNVYNPVGGTVSPQNIYTRYNFGSLVTVVASAPNAVQAPAATAGYIKLAEVTLPTNATSISQADVVDWQRSYLWTNGAASTVWAGHAPRRTVEVTSGYTIPSIGTPLVVMAAGGGAGITVTLPPSSEVPNLRIAIYKSDAAAGTVTIAAQGTDFVDIAGSWVLSSQYESVILQATDGGFMGQPSSISSQAYANVRRDGSGDIYIARLHASNGLTVSAGTASLGTSVLAFTATGLITANAGLTVGSGQSLKIGADDVTPHGYAAFITSTVFIVPEGITTIFVSGCAAGGYGYFGTGVNQGGGGGGEWAVKGELGVTPGATLTVTIGAAGVVTSIGTFVLNPGQDGSASAGGAGGTGGSGNAGGRGGYGYQYSAGAGLAAGGASLEPVTNQWVGGGGGSYGAGGNGQAATTSSADGLAGYGGGGGSATGGGTIGANISGGAAILIVEY